MALPYSLIVIGLWLVAARLGCRVVSSEAASLRELIDTPPDASDEGLKVRLL